MFKSLVYYSDNHCEERILKIVIDRLKNICKEFDIVSVTHKPIDFGRNFTVSLPRGWPAIYKQILIGLEESRADIVYLIEHDVLYHPSHFEFVPTRRNGFYYNLNRASVDSDTGDAMMGRAWMFSQLVGFRETFLELFRERNRIIETEGWRPSMGGSPVAHVSRHSPKKYRLGHFFSEYPNIDIRHGNNFTPYIKKYKPENYPNRDYIFMEEIPGWGRTQGRFDEWLKQLP